MARAEQVLRAVVLRAFKVRRLESALKRNRTNRSCVRQSPRGTSRNDLKSDILAGRRSLPHEGYCSQLLLAVSGGQSFAWTSRESNTAEKILVSCEVRESEVCTGSARRPHPECLSSCHQETDVLRHSRA